MDWFSHCNLVTYLRNDWNEWQTEQKVEQVNKKWGNMSKDPGFGGPLGGLCNILFPKKYNKKYMYQSFLPQCEILSKSIIHVVFMTMCMNVAKEPIFICRWNIYFFTFSPIYFLIMFLIWDKILATNWKILQFSAVVICDNQCDEFLFCNCTKTSTHLKIMVPGLRGPAGGPCKF